MRPIRGIRASCGMVAVMVACAPVIVVSEPAAVARLHEAERRGRQEIRASQSVLDTLRELAVPGEHHEHLARLTGAWEASGSYWLPSGERVDSHASIEAALILDGLFLETRIVTEIDGETYEARGLDGYDDVTGRYVGVYVDSLRTFVLELTGTCREDGRVRTMVTEFIDPVWGRPLKNRVVITLLDGETYRLQSFLMHDDGREFPLSEYTARRVR